MVRSTCKFRPHVLSLVLFLEISLTGCASTSGTTPSAQSTKKFEIPTDVRICARNLLALYKAIDPKHHQTPGNINHEAWEMGLPKASEVAAISLRLRLAPCPGENTAGEQLHSVMYQVMYLEHPFEPGIQANSFRDSYAKIGSNTVIYSDYHHNPRDLNIRNLAEKIFGIGITYEGRIVYQIRKGDAHYQSWWDGAKVLPKQFYEDNTKAKFSTSRDQL